MDFQCILKYCAALDANNNRSWFHEHHKEYEQAREDWFRLLSRLRFVIVAHSPQLANDLLYTQPRDWTYRIARDMRYYKNQPPYNPSFRAYISADRKSMLPIGYFLCIAPGGSLFGTGLWPETTAATNVVRDYISLHSDRWMELADACPIPVTGRLLKTMPRGYSEDHPAAPWLKYKDWNVVQHIPDSQLLTFDAFEETVAKLVEQMEPIRQFLLEAAGSKPAPGHAAEAFFRH